MKKEIIVINPEPKTVTANSQSKIKVAAYCRVSSEKDEQLNSIKTQKDYFKKLLNEHDNWINAGIFYDEGISGTRLKKRDGFNKMISAAIEGSIDLIIVKSISRFARNTVDAIKTFSLNSLIVIIV